MPINTIIMRVIGVRVIALIGSVLAILGMILSAHATEVWQLVMSYSVVTGENFYYQAVIQLPIYDCMATA